LPTDGPQRVPRKLVKIVIAELKEVLGKTSGLAMGSMFCSTPLLGLLTGFEQAGPGALGLGFRSWQWKACY